MLDFGRSRTDDTKKDDYIYDIRPREIHCFISIHLDSSRYIHLRISTLLS